MVILFMVYILPYSQSLRSDSPIRVNTQTPCDWRMSMYNVWSENIDQHRCPVLLPCDRRRYPSYFPWCKNNNWKMTETLAHGTHLRVLSESYPMNTNMTVFRWFPKICASFNFQVLHVTKPTLSQSKCKWTFLYRLNLLRDGLPPSLNGLGYFHWLFAVSLTAISIMA